MNLKKAVFFIILISLFSISVKGQVAFRDVGYQAYPWGMGFFGLGFNPLDSLCLSYSWLVDFIVLFIIFYFIGHQVFNKDRYKKGDLASIAIGIALSFGLARWAAFRGGLICGILSGAGTSSFGNFFGFLVLLGLVFLILWAFVKGSNAGRLMASIGYILFYFWLGSEGGYVLGGFSYYIPLDPYLVDTVLSILFWVAIIIGAMSLIKWRKEG